MSGGAPTPASPSVSRRIAAAFVDSKLTPLIAVASVALGIFAIASTPREQDPSITVPLVQVVMVWPGHSGSEVDAQIAQRASSWIREIAAVEHVITTAADDAAVVRIQFPSGHSDEDAITSVNARLAAHAAELPPGVLPPTVTLAGSDDVPVLTLAFHERDGDPRSLRRLVRELGNRIERMPDVAGVEILGGSRRGITVRPDAIRTVAHGVTAADVERALASATAAIPIGSLEGPDGSTLVRARIDLGVASDLEDLVVGAGPAGLVRLRDVATIEDGPTEPDRYVTSLTRGDGFAQRDVVVMTVRKRRGSNATDVTGRIVGALDDGELGVLMGDRVEHEVVRDDGVIASEKVTTLLEHMGLATLVVMVVTGFALGLRAAMIVGVSIPVTLAFVPFVYQLAGFTLNRITLAAMIFAIGILVDDAIVIIENVHRRFVTRPAGAEVDWVALTLDAVDEVGSPTILATATVIAALAPTAFLSGMIGQFMLPLPVGASVAMVFSLFVALTLTPYLALRMLRGEAHDESHATPRWLTAYASALAWFLANRRRSFGLALGSAAALGLVVVVFVTRIATFRNMPIADVDHVAVVVDLPPDTTLASTQRQALEVARALGGLPEVERIEVYVGAPGPLSFLGIARGYAQRSAPYQAELQVRLGTARSRTSHEVAAAMRRVLPTIAGARIAVAEEPLGPPTLGALVAEVYAPTDDEREALAEGVLRGFRESEGVVDAQRSDAPVRATTWLLGETDRLAVRGIPGASSIAALRALVGGTTPGALTIPGEPEPVPVRVQLPRGERADLEDLRTLAMADLRGRPVPTSDVTRIVREPGSRPLFRKDGVPVVFVTGEMHGQHSSIYPMIDLARELPRRAGPTAGMAILWNDDPPDSNRASVRWAGDWTTTFEMNRDLGFAFLVVLALIYGMLAAWYRSYSIPFVVMLPIPLSLIGVAPGHIALGLPLSGMGTIGVIALAGLMVRNSILLVDFVIERRAAGAELKEAVVLAGGERVRPILLTAATVVLGDGVLYFDPMMQGLGLTMASGALVSTAMTLFLVPVAYYRLAQLRDARAAAKAPRAVLAPSEASV